MKRVHFIIVVAIVIAILTAGIGVTYSASPEKTGSEQPQASFTFGPIITTFTFVVTIPDPNLNQALHQKLGKPMSESITYMELAGLTGNLWLENKDIADAEGIQYCTNISGLYMDNNDLTVLPDMTPMVGLTYASFAFNDFSAFPVGVITAPNLGNLTISRNPMTSVTGLISTMYNLTYLNLGFCEFTSFPTNVKNISSLETLYLNDNDLGSIPGSISGMTNLNYLNLNDTGLTEFPSVLYAMSNLETLFLDENEIASISPDISGMSHLQYLSVIGNKLQHLPEELFLICPLNGVYADDNSLYDLPNTIGGCGIEMLTVSNNRITRLPSNIDEASQLYLLDMMVNRLRGLPSSFDEKTWDFVNIDFNFIDVSPGSDARAIIDTTTITGTFYYERQLKSIDEVLAAPTDTSIMLSWDAGVDGSDGSGATWTVDSYKILDDGYDGIDETLPTELMYDHTGLTPETTYLYHVGVEYHVVVPSHSIDTMIRAYTDLEAATLAEGAGETAAPTDETAAAETDPPEDAADDAADNTVDVEGSADADTAAGTEIVMPDDEKSDFPVWAIVVIAVLGAGVIGACVTFIIVKTKGGKTPTQKRA